MTGEHVPSGGANDDAAELVRVLTERNETLATAESLTGGLLAAAIVDVPGASLVLRGGLVVYATDLKATLAGVPTDLLDARGPVDPDVAVALARGARRRCGATWGVATTGVAGPDPAEGKAPGTVHIAVSAGGTTVTRALALAGREVIGLSSEKMRSIRGGDVVGEHDVIFAADGERVVLRHIATDRAIVARGALKAALWGQDKKPGQYDMMDVLGL